MAVSNYGSSAWKPLARAFVAFWKGAREAELTVHTDEGETEVMPVALFFRGSGELRDEDRAALALARGRVLDGGAGVGSIALILQEQRFRVTALEPIPEAVGIMQARGVADARRGRLEDLPDSEAFDTILLLMNGTSLAGTLPGLPRLLRVLERLLSPGGQILLDSTDLTDGQTEEDSLEAGWDPGDYPGELQYQVEFLGIRGAPFPQLFVDPGTLQRVAAGEGLVTVIVWKGHGGRYVARLTRSDETLPRSRGTPPGVG